MGRRHLAVRIKVSCRFPDWSLSTRASRRRATSTTITIAAGTSMVWMWRRRRHQDRVVTRAAATRRRRCIINIQTGNVWCASGRRCAVCIRCPRRQRPATIIPWTIVPATSRPIRIPSSSNNNNNNFEETTTRRTKLSVRLCPARPWTADAVPDWVPGAVCSVSLSPTVSAFYPLMKIARYSPLSFASPFSFDPRMTTSLDYIYYMALMKDPLTSGRWAIEKKRNEKIEILYIVRDERSHL